MLHRPRSLHFPKLNFLKETSFKPWKHDGTTRVYQLDWAGFNMLPEPYDTWLKRFTFALPSAYFEGIIRCAEMANIEAGHPKPFDTAVRPHMAYVGHVYDAFVLMADCLYDQNKDFYYRGDDKHLVRYALMAKFWFRNAGRGMVGEFAMFHRIKCDALHNWIEHDFLEMMDKFSVTFSENIIAAKRDSGPLSSETPQHPKDEVPQISSENFGDIWVETAKEMCPAVPEGWAPDDGMLMICEAGVKEECDHGPCGCPDILGRYKNGAKAPAEGKSSWSPIIKEDRYIVQQPSVEAKPKTISAGVDPLKNHGNGNCPNCGAEIAHQCADEICSAGCGWTRSGQ